MNTSPYSQHYRCSIELFGSYKTGIVFQYLFDQFLHNYRKYNKDTSGFEFSCQGIERATGIGRHTVSSIINTLEEIGVISIKNKLCTVDAKYYVSAINLFSYSKLGTRLAIRKAFIAHDSETLYKLGIDDSFDLDEEITSLSRGGINLPAFSEGGRNLPQVEGESDEVVENYQSSGRNLPVPEDKTDGVVENYQLTGRNLPVDENENKEVVEIYQEKQNNDKTGRNLPQLEKYIEEVVEIYQLSGRKLPLDEIFTKKLVEIYHLCGKELWNYLTGIGLNVRFDDNEPLEKIRQMLENSENVQNDLFSVDFLLNLAQVGAFFIKGLLVENYHPLVEIYHSTGRNLPPVNIIGGKKNKRETQKKEDGKDKEELPENFKDFKGLELFKLSDELPENSDLSKTSETRKENFKKYKMDNLPENPYRNKPYFPVSETKDFMFDIAQCSGSPVKLFLHNFLWNVYDYWKENLALPEIYDEEGNVEPNYGRPSDIEDMDGSLIPWPVIEDGFLQADTDSADILKAGFIEDDLGKVTFSFTEIPDLAPAFLADWDVVEDTDGKKCVQFSFAQFRNIEADDIQEIQEPKTKEERRQAAKCNRAFIENIMTADKSQLDPLDKAIRNFAETFMVLDEYYHATGFTNSQGQPIDGNTLPGYVIKPWENKLREFGIVPGDFYSILNQPGGYKAGMDLVLTTYPFLAEKVRRIKKLRGY